MIGVHQFLPTWEPGAIGAHAREVQKLMRERGLRSEVFTYESVPSMQGDAHHYSAYGTSFRAHQRDLLVYHCAIGSEVADFVIGRRERLVVDYHNITPPELFAGWDPVVAENLEWGAEQLAALAGRAVLGIADSAFNEGELRGVGFGRTAVVPVLLDLGGLVGEFDVGVLERLSGVSGACWLFVGRLAPNKAQHDLVKALAVYRRVYDPDARLVLVGAASSAVYEVALRRFVSELGLEGAVEFAGSVSVGSWGRTTGGADVFVCVSEHEGFCVPLLEAMAHGVPVVAFGAAAVPETLGGAGLVLDVKSPGVVAAAVGRVLGDAVLREAMVADGRVRLEDFSLERSRERLWDALSPLIEECA
ncbi:MAG: glycosyltransferase family 4 protein [Acidimicrobiia bacterium]|nr:glycosyltransferase family 4 protein [Acidimicrobiia bacterium]